MVKFIRCVGIVLFFCAPALTAQRSVEGFWEGAAVRDGAVRIVRLEIFSDSGRLRGRFDTPDLPTFATAIVPVQQNGEKITVRLPMTGEFALTYDTQADELRGAFSGPQALPISMHLRRGIKRVDAVAREPVRIVNGDIALGGTLITPLTPGPHPVVVWLSGRGSSARSETPLQRLLAERGIASLIYDKRGSGQSTGNFATATFGDLVSDAVAAVAYLAQRKDINAAQVGLHGESAGGWVAPAVATTSATKIAFIVTSVGPAESLYDQQVHAYQAYVRTGGFALTPDEVLLSDDHILKRLRLAFKNEGRDEFVASSSRIKGTRMEPFLLDTEAADAADFDWLRRNDADPVPHLRKITAPFLAFYGTRDYIVPPAHNAKKLEQYLTDAGNKDFTVIVVNGGDHSLVRPNSNRVTASDAAAPARFFWGGVAPDVAPTIIEWLLARVTVARPR